MKKFLSILFCLSFVIFSCNELQAQGRANDWKKIRKEVFIGVGVSNFLGDLGGLNKVGTHYSPVDLEWSLTRPALTIGGRYKIIKNFNIAAAFTYMIVSGDDKLTDDIYRQNRNLNFKSNIFELGIRAEYCIMKNRVGNRYGIRRTLSRRMKASTWDVLLFSGINGFYFNPKGKAPTGGWVDLYSLHTEGQGLPGGPKQYTRYSISIPFGAAYRYYPTKQWCIGVEASVRKTFTDYIDDVSGIYYNKTALASAYGPLSAVMADPSTGQIPGATSPNADGTGAQRGNPKQKDFYMSFQVTFSYFFKPVKGKTRLRSKF